MNQIKIQGVCTCVPQFSYEKDRRGRSVPTCRYILAVQRPKSSYSDYMYCVAFGERAMIAFQKIKKGTTVFVQGHLHTEEGRDANNQKVYFVTVTVDYQQIIEKQEFNGLELCTAPVSGSETGRKRRKIENADSVYYPDYSGGRMCYCIFNWKISQT